MNIKSQEVIGRSENLREVRGSEAGLKGGTIPQMEDDLSQNGRRPHPKRKTTLQKWKMTKNEDDQKQR